MTAEEAIKQALAGEEVRWGVTLMNMNSEREKIQKAALAITDQPIEILTRTHCVTYAPYLLIRKYTTGSVPYEQVEKEARDKGWIE